MEDMLPVRHIHTYYHMNLLHIDICILPVPYAPLHTRIYKISETKGAGLVLPRLINNQDMLRILQRLFDARGIISSSGGGLVKKR